MVKNDWYELQRSRDKIYLNRYQKRDKEYIVSDSISQFILSGFPTHSLSLSLSFFLSLYIYIYIYIYIILLAFNDQTTWRDTR